MARKTKRQRWNFTNSRNPKKLWLRSSLSMRWKTFMAAVPSASAGPLRKQRPFLRRFSNANELDSFQTQRAARVWRRENGAFAWHGVRDLGPNFERPRKLHRHRPRRYHPGPPALSRREHMDAFFWPT